MISSLPPNGLRRVRAWCMLIVSASVLAASPAVSGAERPAAKPAGQQEVRADSLEAQARAVLARAASYLRSISTHGGYAGIYDLETGERFGEARYQPADSSEIWIQPPGTPSVGEAFLAAYEATGEDRYLEAARETARALVWGQRENGCWSYLADLAHVENDESEIQKNPRGVCTLDDNTTQGALDFLMNLDTHIDAPWLTKAIDLGIDYLLESQFENGAWPQRYPLGSGPEEANEDEYSDYYTYNDAVINEALALVLKAHHRYGKETYLEALRRAGRFIVVSQIQAPQAGWAQQYDHQMNPAWARSFEPPGVCSAVTARNIETLVDLHLYTGDHRYLEPIPAAVDWLRRSPLEDQVWARLYELKTNRPIYGDRDGKIHYALSEISEERREGYSWEGAFGVPEAIAYYERIRKLGRKAWLERHDRSEVATGPLSPAPGAALSDEELEHEVESIIAAEDGAGRWVTKGGTIESGTYVRNIHLLSAYLGR